AVPESVRDIGRVRDLVDRLHSIRSRKLHDFLNSWSESLGLFEIDVKLENCTDLESARIQPGLTKYLAAVASMTKRTAALSQSERTTSSTARTLTENFTMDFA
ncbi:hypothetical protein KIPB_014175, partial [Kipferlia bialata]